MMGVNEIEIAGRVVYTDSAGQLPKNTDYVFIVRGLWLFTRRFSCGSKGQPCLQNLASPRSI